MTFTAEHIAGDEWRVHEEDGRTFDVVVRAGGTADDAIAAVVEVLTGPTHEQIAADLAVDHMEKVKAECRRRILAVASEIAQNNVARAVTIYTTARVRGATEAEAETLSRLSDADIVLAGAFDTWVAEMLAASRTMVEDVTADFYADASWPTVPAGVAELAARF